jgi:hypothetical protein
LKIIVIPLLLISLGLFSQETSLVISGKQNSSEKIIPAQTYVKIVAADGHVSKGTIMFQNDSVILVDNDTLFLNDIRMLRLRLVNDRAAGWVITSIGGVTALTGIAVIIKLSELPGFWSIIVALGVGFPVLTGGIIITTAGIVTVVAGKKYRSSRWNYSIQNARSNQ